MDIGGQTGTTDEDGEFIIEDVPAGKWPVTVIDKDGNVIGIGEITITGPGGGSLTITVDGNGNSVVTPGKDTGRISLTLTIGEDGVISIGNIKDATPAAITPDKPGSTGGSSPETGDPYQPNVWIAGAAAAAAGLVVIGLVYRRKKSA